MLDLKALLTKMLQDYYKIPTFYMYGAVSDYKTPTTSTWYALSNFTGYSSTRQTNANEYFGTDLVNGVRILKKGIYRLDLNGHMNGANNNVIIMQRFLNNTTSSTIGEAKYVCCITNSMFGTMENHLILTLNPNDVILPQFGRYNGTGNFKPTNFRFSVQLVQNLE